MRSLKNCPDGSCEAQGLVHCWCTEKTERLSHGEKPIADEKKELKA